MNLRPYYIPRTSWGNNENSPIPVRPPVGSQPSRVKGRGGSRACVSMTLRAMPAADLFSDRVSQAKQVNLVEALQKKIFVLFRIKKQEK